LSVKRQPTVAEGIVKQGQEFAAKQPTHYRHGQKESRPTSDPPAAVRSDASARHHTVDVRVQVQILAPGVQHREKANVGAKVLRVGRKLQQRLRRDSLRSSAAVWATSAPVRASCSVGIGLDAYAAGDGRKASKSDNRQSRRVGQTIAATYFRTTQEGRLQRVRRWDALLKAAAAAQGLHINETITRTKIVQRLCRLRKNWLNSRKEI